MGIFQGIMLLIGALKYIPEIIKAIREIMALFKALKGTPGFDQKELLTEFRLAVKEAKEKKDTGRLARLHRRLSRLCTDSNCPVSVHDLSEEVASDLADGAQAVVGGSEDAKPEGYAGFRS